MSEASILVEGLGKQYRIGARQAPYRTLRETIVSLATLPVRRLGSRGRSNGEWAESNTIWALKDVSFEVKQGDVVGIIGRNGAGKSTLLKVLSRITKPTDGRVSLVGRVGSLLEVGTGFHPELTGRENIYLNGAILGMRRVEIGRKFDEIVAFAEIDKFLDTPVKHYSSGMYVRLAFAVAAHLEPEILLVDEVLAVGDSRFQEKCLGKMSQAAGEGRTLLFVSHSMAAIQRLCSIAVVLEKGHVHFEGATEEAIREYTQESARVASSHDLRNRVDRRGDGELRFTEIRICDDQGRHLDRVLTGQSIRIRLYYESDEVHDRASVNVNFNVFNSQGVLLTNLNSRDVGRLHMPVGRSGRFECSWPRFNLRSGIYTCSVYCEIGGSIKDWIQSAFSIRVEDGDFYSTGYLLERGWGDVLVEYDWAGWPAEEQGDSS